MKKYDNERLIEEKELNESDMGFLGAGKGLLGLAIKHTRITTAFILLIGAVFLLFAPSKGLSFSLDAIFTKEIGLLIAGIGIVLAIAYGK